MNDNGHIIGIDIGGTNFRVGQVSCQGEVSNVQIMPSKFLAEADDSVARLGEYIKAYIEKHRIEGEICVSIGFPGCISADRKRTHSVPNLKNEKGQSVFDNREISDTLSAALGIPVIINRDVNNLLEYDMFDKQLSGTVVSCYIGTGFGGSVFINGDFLLGKNGVANEIGHIPFYKSKRVCSCGNIGCAECYACGAALSRLQSEKYPDTFIADMFRKHAQDQELIDFVDACSIPIATQINIFDPDHVIIGGGVVDMAGFPKQLLVDYVLFHSRKPYPAENLSLLFANSNKERGVIGAALWAMRSNNIPCSDEFKTALKKYMQANNE